MSKVDQEVGLPDPGAKKADAEARGGRCDQERADKQVARASDRPVGCTTARS
jgi:hypothetical protein